MKRDAMIVAITLWFVACVVGGWFIGYKTAERLSRCRS